MAPVQRQYGLGQLGQLGRGFAQLGLGHGGRTRHRGQRVAQLRQHARLLVFGKLLDIDAQQAVNAQQHSHGERALILLQLIHIAGRQAQRVRERQLRHAALGAQRAQTHAHESLGHK
ncbi:hypothetical protein D3C86_1639160 [compost metagenome]